jgi:hypothetical protein
MKKEPQEFCVKNNKQIPTKIQLQKSKPFWSIEGKKSKKQWWKLTDTMEKKREPYECCVEAKNPEMLVGSRFTCMSTPEP